MTTYGPDEIIACPKCSKPLRQSSLASGNTFGAVYWSDGKREAPMLPTYPAVTRCNHCRTIFWVKDAETLGNLKDVFGEDQDAESPREWDDAPKIDHLDADGLVEAIDMADDSDRVQFLRMKLWHTLNDHLRRDQANDFEGQSEIFERNLEVLIQILDEADPSGRISKAEALRELGRHEEAISLLSGADEELKWVVTQIMSSAEAGNAKVFKLELPESS